VNAREILDELLRNRALVRCLLRAIGVFDDRAIVVQADTKIAHVGRVVVLAIDDATAELVRGRGQRVVGPTEIPPIADDDETRAPLAILDAIVHAHNRSPHTVDAALCAYRVLPSIAEDRREPYWNAIVGALDDATREELQKLLPKR